MIRQIAYSLAHLMSILECMEPAWSRALLKRTRFIDPDFQGDILAVISQTFSAPSPQPILTPSQVWLHPLFVLEIPCLRLHRHLFWIDSCSSTMASISLIKNPKKTTDYHAL